MARSVGRCVCECSSVHVHVVNVTGMFHKVESTPMESLPRGLPASVDWRDSGVVTDVKNQGFCGSCWTFSATEALESAVAIATGELYTFSEQEFVSCVENPDECGGTGGCDGATMELAFEYAMENGMTR